MNGTMPPAMMLPKPKLPEIRSAISTATAAEIPGSRMVRPADLSPTMKPPIANAREIEHRGGEQDLASAQLDLFGSGGAFELGPEKQAEDQAGDQIEHDHHDHADADPLPVQRAGHFSSLSIR